MESVKYACLGCKYCFPAVATNIFNQTFQEAIKIKLLNSDFDKVENKKTWFPIAGEYFAFCEGSSCPIAVSTLSSIKLAEDLANNRPKELCIVGKTETENIGIDKVIKNTISNQTVQVVIIAGKDSEGHYSGNTLLALWENGVDKNMKVIGSKGKLPILKNVSQEEVETFRKQIKKIVNMIGNEDVEAVIKRIKEVSKDITVVCDCHDCNHAAIESLLPTSTILPIVEAKEPQKVEMDKAGYFVINPPQTQRGIITVEHYSYDNQLLRVIEGKDARSIYLTIIENKWITQLSHAAYLGKELAKAELSLKLGFKFIQDKA
jgi:tetrahydromethanopterin S-methyltransferase subunit A